MELLTMIILAVAISVDVFFCATAYGIAQKPLKSFPLLVTLISTLFISGAVLLGITIPESISNFLGGTSLTLIGFLAILTSSSFNIKELGLSESLILSATLSVDDFSIGLNIANTTNPILIILIIALVKPIIIFLGYKLGGLIKVSHKKTTCLTGLFLIILGVLKLL